MPIASADDNQAATMGGDAMRGAGVTIEPHFTAAR